MICPECDGWGEIPKQAIGNDDTEICNACNGTGEEPEPDPQTEDYYAWRQRRIRERQADRE